MRGSAKRLRRAIRGLERKRRREYEQGLLGHNLAKMVAIFEQMTEAMKQLKPKLEDLCVVLAKSATRSEPFTSTEAK